jgi:hypothetical protein
LRLFSLRIAAAVRPKARPAAVHMWRDTNGCDHLLQPLPFPHILSRSCSS